MNSNAELMRVEDELAALRRKVDRLVAALRPFQRAWVTGRYGRGLSAANWKRFADAFGDLIGDS